MHVRRPRFQFLRCHGRFFTRFLCCDARRAPSLLAVKPNIPAPLDPHFYPYVLGSRNYLRAAHAYSGTSSTFHVVLERHQGLAASFAVPCFPSEHPNFGDTCTYIERRLKFLLWQKGGHRLHLCGDEKICDYLRAIYERGARKFDADFMSRIYHESFQILVHNDENKNTMPAAHDLPVMPSGDLNGCRIGFDLGGSDFKLAAVRDGDPFFTTEIPWDPYNEPDPQKHWEALNAGLAMVKSKFADGQIDAIGGSSAGVLISNEFRAASLFRSVPSEEFDVHCRPMMRRLEEKWGVPVVCINDGEVTALAGARSIGKTSLLGIAMGTSEAAGFLDVDGHLTSWLNELAFAPVAFSSDEANRDEWSGDVGVGCMYFSQQAVNKLAPAAGYTFPSDLPLPRRLKAIQDAQQAGEEGAAQIYESIGVYLGYTAATYAEFYDDLQNIMVLGRVTSGTGADVMLEKAREVLAEEFPELLISLHVPDETMKRVGQSVAAAALPRLKQE